MPGLKLDKCATLVVVGYSLPETDLIARALFAEVARVRRARGKYLKELHIADISADAKDRIVDLFLPEGRSEFLPEGRSERYADIAAEFVRLNYLAGVGRHSKQQSGKPLASPPGCFRAERSLCLGVHFLRKQTVIDKLV